MRFLVVPNDSAVPSEGKDTAFLWTDNWNDYWDFKTLYVLTYYDRTGARHDMGGVKIGQFGWKPEQQRPEIPQEFSELDIRFFSLGQDVSYYQAAGILGIDVAKLLLGALRDVVASPELFTKASDERVMGTSLMRSVGLSSVKGQFPRVLAGGAPLTGFSFSYKAPALADPSEEPLKLEFEVTPDATPPTNIHVIIGRNGVGKTYLLNGMTRALVSTEKNESDDGVFRSQDGFLEDSTEIPFANIVSVTFSAFDEFAIIRRSKNVLKSVQYANVGLRCRVKAESGDFITVTRDPADLAEEFSSSAKACLSGTRGERWVRALTTLQADPIFEEAQVVVLARLQIDEVARQASQLFRKLSSGHKIVLLTITKLVETVEEKTLVVMDEPESHLHPPLLSAFIRALSDLLIHRNGVSIIATHSPVVLQEVPSSCVWKIVRHGSAAKATRPQTETFGENVGILTREVFGLEVTRSGFHRMLAGAIGPTDTLETVLAKFGNEVGSDGRALISSMLANRESSGG
jgi:predicted ATPase